MVFSPLGIPALELFCGIGGFAAAVADSNVHVIAALDQSPAALAAYQYNYPDHPARSCDLEKITATELAGYAADLTLPTLTTSGILVDTTAPSTPAAPRALAGRAAL